MMQKEMIMSQPIKLRFIILMTTMLFLLSACDGELLKESAEVMGGVGAGLSEYQE
jgi:hypothetical protein